MWISAYQSWLWNRVAQYRLCETAGDDGNSSRRNLGKEEHPFVAIASAGDLVLLYELCPPPPATVTPTPVSADPTSLLLQRLRHQKETLRTKLPNDNTSAATYIVHALTAEEVVGLSHCERGELFRDHVVLPLPGCGRRMHFPLNESGR